MRRECVDKTWLIHLLAAPVPISRRRCAVRDHQFVDRPGAVRDRHGIRCALECQSGGASTRPGAGYEALWLVSVGLGSIGCQAVRTAVSEFGIHVAEETKFVFNAGVNS